jgi:hypothetical protein
MDGSSPLLAKLSHLMPLSDEDVRILDALCLNEERFAANIDIVHEDDVPRSAFVLTRGMAFRYRLMPDGKRQILTFMIPGDIFGLQAFLLTAMDHSIHSCADAGSHDLTGYGVRPVRQSPVARQSGSEASDNEDGNPASRHWHDCRDVNCRARAKVVFECRGATIRRWLRLSRGSAAGRDRACVRVRRAGGSSRRSSQRSWRDGRGGRRQRPS